MARKCIHIIFMLVCALAACSDPEPLSEPLTLLRAFAGATELDLDGTSENIPVDQSLSFVFSKPLNTNTAAGAVTLAVGTPLDYSISFSGQNATLVIHPSSLLENNTQYTVRISDALAGENGEPFSGAEVRLRTVQGVLSIVSVTIGGKNAMGSSRMTDVPLTPEIAIEFSFPLDEASLQGSFAIEGPGSSAPTHTLSTDKKSVTLTGVTLKDLTRYRLVIARSEERRVGN